MRTSSANVPESVCLIGLNLLYGLLHPLTELGGAAVLQAAAVGLHAPAEGGHGLVLALDGVAGVGKGVEEQDHAPAGGYAVVNGAGVAHPVCTKSASDIFVKASLS